LSQNGFCTRNLHIRWSFFNIKSFNFSINHICWPSTPKQPLHFWELKLKLINCYQRQNSESNVLSNVLWLADKFLQWRRKGRWLKSISSDIILGFYIESNSSCQKNSSLQNWFVRWGMSPLINSSFHGDQTSEPRVVFRGSSQLHTPESYCGGGVIPYLSATTRCCKIVQMCNWKVILLYF
jgi:hypothetical protein